jgi:hypothetical protein
VLFSHTGAPSIQERHAQEFVDRLAMTGAKEVVCFHDDCYTMLTTSGVGIRDRGAVPAHSSWPNTWWNI